MILEINIWLLSQIIFVLIFPFYFTKKYYQQIEKLKQEINVLSIEKNLLLVSIKDNQTRIKSILHQQISDTLLQNRTATEFLSTCLICFEDNIPLIVLLPCGHVFGCQECLSIDRCNHCYICQAQVNARNRIYFLMEQS